MPTVLVDKERPHITVIRMNRPERLNAMSIELCVGLKDELENVGRDNDCWVVILTGAGRSFCSGLDLRDDSMIPNIDGLTIPQDCKLDSGAGADPHRRYLAKRLIGWGA